MALTDLLNGKISKALSITAFFTAVLTYNCDGDTTNVYNIPKEGSNVAEDHDVPFYERMCEDYKAHYQEKHPDTSASTLENIYSYCLELCGSKELASTNDCAKMYCSVISPNNKDYKNEWTASGIDCVCSFGANPDDLPGEGADEDICD